MSKFLLYLLFISTPIVNAQTNIPKIDFETKYESTNKYIQLLNLKDTNSLIITTGRSGMHGVSNLYIVYQTDGKIRKYIGSYPKQKKQIQEKNIQKENYHFYWEFLEQCVQEKKFELNEAKLKVVPDSLSKTNSHTDDFEVSFGIYKNNEGSQFSIYEGESYVLKNHPNNIERKKLSNLVSEIETLYSKY